MKKKLLTFVLLTLSLSHGFSQSKTFIDQPYLETTASVDTLVVPDRIFLAILINESDTKGKISVEELENKMAVKLKSLGIDLNEQLTLSDLGSNFKKYFLKNQKIEKNKSYSLLLYNAKSAGEVIANLEEIGISNIELGNIEYSKLDQLTLDLKSRAILKARSQGNHLAIPLGQKIGPAIFISDKLNRRYGSNDMEKVVVRGYTANKADYEPLDIEFEKIKIESEVFVRFKLD